MARRPEDDVEFRAAEAIATSISAMAAGYVGWDQAQQTLTTEAKSIHSVLS